MIEICQRLIKQDFFKSSFNDKSSMRKVMSMRVYQALRGDKAKLAILYQAITIFEVNS